MANLLPLVRPTLHPLFALPVTEGKRPFGQNARETCESGPHQLVWRHGE